MSKFLKKQSGRTAPKISTQLWEVLTVFTITLSIATGIIWFNNNTPKEIQQDFVFVDRVKSSIFNDVQKISNLPNISNEEKVKNIDVEWVNIDEEEYQEYIKLVNESQESFNNLISNLKKLDNEFEDLEVFNSTINDYENYLTEKRILYENFHTSSIKNLEIKKEINRLAKTDISEYQDSQTIKENMDYLKKIELNDNEFLAKVVEWETKMQDLKNSAENGYFDTESVAELKELYKSIIKYPVTNQTQVKKLEESKTKLMASLETLENWQQQYMKDNQNMLSGSQVTVLSGLN